MNRPNNRATLQRRHLLAGIASAPLAAIPAASAQTALRPSPAQTLGPFYPRHAAERPTTTDADLLTVQDGKVLSEGVPIFLLGRVRNARGLALAGATVEIWQCDGFAVYHHPAGGAVEQRDVHFQGYGVALTDAAGDFRFRTIRPIAYPGRTPHIHVRIQPAAGQGRAFATQLYVPDHPGNARDFLFAGLNRDEQQALLLRFEPTRDDHPLAQATQLTARTELVIG